MILASQSPRRIELMREAGYNIRVIPADIDETPFDGEAPLTLVERLARAKAAAVAAEYAEPNELTVAADTIVTFDGKILGKLFMPPIDLVFGLWQGPNHCKNAYIKEFERKNYPEEYRAGVPIFEPRK